MFDKWQGKILVNDKEIQSAGFDFKSINKSDNIKLLCNTLKDEPVRAGDVPEHICDVIYKIKVKQYMTKKSTPEFNFMSQWNNDEPMPLRIMCGTVEKETRGMVYMKLHGDIFQERTIFCMKCGRELKNLVSQFFGIGPECGGHNYTNPFDNEIELKEAVRNYRSTLQNIKWEGWIIKSAIEEMEELK